MALYKRYFKDTVGYRETYGDKTVILIQVGAFLKFTENKIKNLVK